MVVAFFSISVVPEKNFKLNLIAGTIKYMYSRATGKNQSFLLGKPYRCMSYGK